MVFRRLLIQLYRECKCDCDETLKPYVTCDHLTTTIQRKPKHNVWIGTCDENVTATSSQYCFIIHPNCPFDYCIPPTNYSIDLSTSNGLDTQCAFHHSGLLCGSCKPGWSLSIGSSGCIKCPKSWPGLVIAIIVYIIFFGMIMVAVIVVLDLTVAKGTINGVLFYANVVGSSSNIFLKVESTKVLTIFLNFLNVTIGFDACFSERMNATLKTWLGLLFSGYVFALIFILIQLSKYSPRFARLFGKGNPVATLATLMLLFYAKLLRYTIKIFSFAIIKYPNDSHMTVWRPDASVKYFSSVHTPLFMIGLLIIAVGLVYTILLFCWQWLVQLPKIKILKWLRNSRLHLFMEANQAPYKPKYRFWTGLLLFVRILLSLTSALNVSNSSQLNLLAVGVSITSLIIFKAYIGDTIYRNALIDYLEFTCYFNIILLTVATSYYLGQTKSQSIATAISISIILVMFLCILLYHIVLALRNMKWAKRLKVNSFGKKRKFSKSEELCLTLQEVEMNGVEVTTPTSSVVSLSPQHDNTAQSAGKEHVSHCSDNNNQITITNNYLTQDTNSRMKTSNYRYKDNTLQDPLLQVT